MKLLSGFILAGLIAIASVPASAHHSFSAFNIQTEKTVTGTVKQVDWTNPHTWIWLDVANTQGGVDTWGFEGMSPNYLERRGCTKSTLKPCDKISVTFHPMRDGSNGGMFLNATLPDGKVLRMTGQPTEP